VSIRQSVEILRFHPPRAGLLEITGDIVRWTGAQAIGSGLLTLFCRHTSASLVIQENAAPEVRADLEDFIAELAPESPGRYRHDDEGPDDMPAHIRAALTGVQLSIPVSGGRPALGTWQGIYLFEHRRRPTTREVACHLMGE
jgi:secondary thiamine-phosphate synthase enzyme